MAPLPRRARRSSSANFIATTASRCWPRDPYLRQIGPIRRNEKIVAVRPDDRDAAAQLLRSVCAQASRKRRGKRLPQSLRRRAPVFNRGSGLRKIHARRSVRDGERRVSGEQLKVMPCAGAKRLDGADAESQQVRCRRGQFGVPERELALRATGLRCGPIPSKAAQQAVPLFQDAPIPRERPEVGATRLANGDVQVPPPGAGSSRDEIDILRGEVDGCELPDGVDRAHRPIIESNHFLERTLTSFTQRDADLELMATVTPLELAAQAGIGWNRQVNAAVPVRDLALRRRAR